MIEKPKKERRFLKALGRVGEILIEQVLIKVGSSLIKRIGGKKTLPSILFLFLSFSLFAQFPTNINKQRLGFQTTADGLVWRGSISDTASIQPVSNQNAWVILDTVNLKIYSFDFTSNVWNQVGASNPFNQPIDSLFFKTSVSPNNVDTAKMRWDSELGTVVLGMYDQVPNELGFKNFWLVKNQTGSTITKGSIVYANGTVGASGRITVAKFIANGTIDAKYLLGITAHDLSNGEDGYVISFGKIRQVNTDTFAAGAILYPSPTVAGVWTDVEPIAPNLDMPIGFCINSSSNNGTIAIRVASGYSLNELHNVAISSPVEKSSLYYTGGLWRDTTAALLVSDTASMLTPYFRDADTTSLNLVSRFAAKQNILNGTGFVKASGTNITYDNSSYLRTGLADSTYLKLTGGTLSKTTVYPSSDTILTKFFIKSGANNFIPTYAIFAEAEHHVSQGAIGIYGKGSSLRGTTIGIQGLGVQTDMNGFGTAIGVRGDVNATFANSGGTNGTTYAGYFSNNATVDGNNYGLFVNTSNKGDYGIYQTGTGINYFGSNSTFAGTLGVTGATTLTGALSGTTGNFSTSLGVGTSTASPVLYAGGSGNQEIHFYSDPASEGTETILRLTNKNAGFYTYGAYFKSIFQRGLNEYHAALGAGLTEFLYLENTAGGAKNLGIFNSNPSYNLDLTGTFNATGNSLIGGTLGVTGATTLSGALTVNNATVFNEGSDDFDTRIESSTNANMVFVDAGLDRVGIGTGSPSKTLDVNGEVKIATVTATPTALLGKDGSNVVGEVTDINQSGVMKVGSITENTSSVGIINVPHGLSYTPTKVIATIAQQSSYVIVCHGITSTNLNFTIYDSTDGTALNNVSVGFFWIAFK
jgi:hypothetical protein